MQQPKVLYLILYSSILSADQFSFLIYNDFFTGADRHFTNGTAISWLDDTFDSNHTRDISPYSNTILNLVEVVPFRSLKNSRRYNAGISLSQIIVTPANTQSSQAQYNDIPYAGYLALSIYLLEWNPKEFFESRLEIGVVGKESGAGLVQNAFHSIIGNDSAKGWDTQLGTTAIVNALFRQGEISWQLNSTPYQADWFNHHGIQLGNFSTSLFAGSIFRIGQNYIKNFNVHYPYLRTESSLLQISNKQYGFGYSFSAGLNAETILYSYILDEAKKAGYATDKRIINISFYTGMDLLYNSHTLTYFYQLQSPYTYQQERYDTFGGLLYSYRY